jgi:hypothetical protein
VEKLRTTSLVLDKKKILQRYVWAANKLKDIGAEVTTVFWKSLRHLALQSGA